MVRFIDSRAQKNLPLNTEGIYGNLRIVNTAPSPSNAPANPLGPL